jgi:prepilin peptidase CpaA
MCPTFLIPMLVAVFPALMALAASMDLLTMTIPNRIPAALAFGYLVSAAALGLPPQAVLFDLSCGLAILALTFVMFSLRWIGGGDAKLAAATALWMGWSSVLDYGVAAAICGGLLTLGLLAARERTLPAMLARHAWIARLHDRGTGVPYGIALAAAGLVQYPHTQIWASAFV